MDHVWTRRLVAIPREMVQKKNADAGEFSMLA
jgi:hypothetical protein